MKAKIIVLILVGVIMLGGTTYVSAQDYVPWHHYDECLEMGEIPKLDKFGKEGHIVSCISINPFEK